MSDLVERLRVLEQVERELSHDGDCPPEATANHKYAETCADAAARIEALEAEVKVWQGHTKMAVWSDSEECKLLSADNEALRAEVEKLTARTQRYLDRNVIFSQEVTRLRRIIDPLFDDEDAEHEPDCGINATPCYPAGICTCKYSLHSLLSTEINTLRARIEALEAALREIKDRLFMQSCTCSFAVDEIIADAALEKKA